jgi:hypothetical protein
MPKVQHEERTLKTARGKCQFIYKDKLVRIIADISSETVCQESTD